MHLGKYRRLNDFSKLIGGTKSDQSYQSFFKKDISKNYQYIYTWHKIDLDSRDHKLKYIKFVKIGPASEL